MSIRRTSTTCSGRWRRAAIRRPRSTSSTKPGARRSTRASRRRRARRATSPTPSPSSTPAGPITGRISTPKPATFPRKRGGGRWRSGRTCSNWTEEPPLKRFWIFDFGFWIGGQENISCSVIPELLSDNRKSQTCPEQSRRIQNLKSSVLAVLWFVAATAHAAELPKWQTEWEQTLAAAKKEGEISFYGSQGYEKVFEVFQKRYPEIKVNAVTNMRGSEHGARVMTERRAGKYLVDLFINGVVTPIQVYLKANILEPIRPQLILPEVVDESKWWEGKHHYADPEGKYIFVFQGNVHGGENAYNTKLVNP